MGLLHLSFIPLVIFALASPTNGQTLAELPREVVEDILTILVGGIVKISANCTGLENGSPRTEYWLYNRYEDFNYVKTHVLDYINPYKPIIFLVHGWSWDANVSYIQQLKDSYLDIYDANIIAVNWGAYAKQGYTSAYCASFGVAENFANFLCDLHSKLFIPLDNVHIVAHSMGAHIAGNAGGRAQQICGARVGRLTGLDPAGPLFSGIDPKYRLDKTDASFVDVIHTNQGQYGYVGALGHKDFYPNCGYFQKGCFSFVKENGASLLNLPLDLVSCNHRRSCDYFLESVQSDLKFIGVSCTGCGTPFCFPKLFHKTESVMGEKCKPLPKSETEEYVLETNSEPLYAKQNLFKLA